MNADDNTATGLDPAPKPNAPERTGFDIYKICVVVLLVLIGAEDMIGPLI